MGHWFGESGGWLRYQPGPIGPLGPMGIPCIEPGGPPIDPGGPPPPSSGKSCLLSSLRKPSFCARIFLCSGFRFSLGTLVPKRKRQNFKSCSILHFSVNFNPETN